MITLGSEVRMIRLNITRMSAHGSWPPGPRLCNVRDDVRSKQIVSVCVNDTVITSWRTGRPGERDTTHAELHVILRWRASKASARATSRNVLVGQAARERARARHTAKRRVKTGVYVMSERRTRGVSRAALARAR